MSTETQTGSREAMQADGQRARRARSAHRHRQPHRATYELPITDGTVRAMDLRQIKVGPRRLRPDGLRPGVHEHGLLPQRDHLHRRRRRHPPAPRLPDRAALRALQLPRGRLPADQRPPAHPQPARGWVDEITIHTFVHENVKDFMQGFRYDANPMGMLVASVGALSTFYPDANKIHDERVRGDPDHPPAREDADARRLRLPAQHGPALRLPRQRPQLRGQLPGDDVQNDRAQVRARSSPGARAGRALHPARRPRTERLHERRALRRLDPGRPLHGGRRRRRRALRARCTAAPTRRRCGCSRGSRRSRTSPTSSRASRRATSA